MVSTGCDHRRLHVPLRRILALYLSVAKRYPRTGISSLLLYGIGFVLGDVIVKLFYRDLIDVIAQTPHGAEAWGSVGGIFLRIVITIIATNVCYRIADFLHVFMQANVLRELQNVALQRLQRHSYSFFIGSFTGGLVAKVKRFTRAFETLHDRFTFSFWETGIGLSGVLIVLLVTMPVLAAFFAAWCILYLTVSFGFVRYRMRFDLVESEADSAVTAQLADIITNVLNLKVFASGGREMQRFADVTGAEYRARIRAWYIANGFYALQGFSMALLEIAGMYITLRLWLQGSVTPGTVVLIQSYFVMVMTSTWNLGRAMSEAFKALSDAEEMVAILEKPIEIADPASPEPPRITRGAITLENIAFSYQSGRMIFSDFTVVVPPGQRVGIVGHSGAGKSTFFKLLLRFVDVTGGRILIDGQDIRSVRQDDLRQRLSYVPQDPILFHRSLYENIAYARPDALREEVIEAAKRAHAHDFIVSLPQGYDTLVGERGVKLSGGERQRIAIARVILQEAPILLLDEATSSLDSTSERYIQEQLKVIMAERTTLAIAHRISTIRQMDRIIVIEDGKIIEDGSHEELLARGATYAQLWEHQSQGFLVE